MVGGPRKERITIQRATITYSEFNEPIETWTDLATVWAKRMDASAGESYRAQEVGAQITMRFSSRWESTTCKLNAVDPQAWLADILTRLVNGWPMRKIDDLMPWA